jgi:hypothetical protein
MSKHRKSATLRLAAYSATLGASLSGCIGKALTGIDSAYPKEWEPRAGIPSSSVCTNLTGNYQDRGDYSYLVKDSDNDSLSKRLTRVDWQAESVRLSLPDSDTIVVEILEDKAIKHSETLRRSHGDFDCDSRGTKLADRNYSGADGGGIYKSNVRLYLRTSVDGALIGEERNSSGGALLWLAPVGGVQANWIRWKKVE